VRATEPVTAKGIEATRDGLVIILEGRRISIPWEKCSPKLAEADNFERMAAELSPGGYGIHWSRLDEDLSINGLLQNFG
jgi:Protein of unknown function (DUF2442)